MREVLPLLLALLAFVWPRPEAGAGGAGLGAQDFGVALSGRFDSSMTAISPAEGQADWTALGSVDGYLTFTGGSQAVKTEVKLGVATYPAPALSLQRAQVKFRFPGFRSSLGLGRIAWGPGFVFVPGDLFFDSTGLSVDFGSDELRDQNKWLMDYYVALGEEAFVEFAAASPPTATTNSTPPVVLPGNLAASTAGLRLSAAPGGVSVEAAYAYDGENRVHKAALSTQFNLGIDWYLSLRGDFPSAPGAGYRAEEGLSSSLGAFGIATLGETVSLSTRHELYLRPWKAWTQDSASAAEAGTGKLPYGLYTYHDLSFALPESLSLSLRGILSPADASALGMVELGWAPLQSLRLYLRGTVQVGEADDTFGFGKQGGVSLGLGAVGSW